MRYRWNTVSPPTNHTHMNEYTIRTMEAGDRDSARHTVRCPSSIRIFMYSAHIANTYTHNNEVDDTNMKKNR
jgi:hypothetical protein